MARVLDFSISFEPEFIASSLARIWKLEGGKFVRRRDAHNHAVDTCPISLEPMQDPVLMSDGHIYEKDSILQWLASGNKCSPCTRAELTHKWVLRLLPYIQTTELLLSSQGDGTPTEAQSISCPDSISAVKLYAAKCAEALETCINSPRDLGRTLLSAQPLFTELEETSARLLRSLDQLREAAKQESQALTDAAVHRIQRWVRHNMAVRRRKKQAAQLAELCSNALLKGKLEIVAKCFDRTDIDYRQVVANLRMQGDTLRQELDSHLTPLQKAARAGLVHAARLLLRAGLTRDDINLFVSDLAGEDDVAFSNSTCLHLAVHPNHVNMTRFLCQELADVDKPCTSINVTALVLAARFDHCEIIEELVRARADMEKATKDFGCTPLFEAVGQGKVAAVESLCRLRAQINRSQTVGFTPLFLSARTGVEQVTSILIRLRANLEKADVNSGFTPLCEAARRGHAEVIRALCVAGAEKDAVTKSGFSPLLLAASNNRIESLKALCDAGVDKDKLYRLKIWDAAPGDLEIGSTEHTILSCILGEAAVRRKMKESKGKQHITVWDSGSTLFASAFQNQPEIVQALCEKKADMNRPTSETQLTALFIAAVRGHEEVVRTLIHASADVRRRAGKTQITPATAAARAGRGKVAGLLAELADEEDFAESSDKKLEVHTLEDVIRRTEVKASLTPLEICHLLGFLGAFLSQNQHHLLSTDFTIFLSICGVLFSRTISGGISWGELAPPLMLVNPVVTPILTLYIALATFCVLNIVTGVFVDRSAAMALQDEENMMLEEIQNRKRWIKEIETLFAKADTDQSGNVEWEEFENALADLRVQLCFKNLGIDLHKVSLEQIWQLIDFDNKGYIEISEFADCLLEMHGVAHSIDIARLRHEQQRTARKLEHVLRCCKALLALRSLEISRALVKESQSMMYRSRPARPSRASHSPASRAASVHTINVKEGSPAAEAIQVYTTPS
ncbi:ANKHD1, partial [Symbiodinium sp. KB8]